MPGPSSSTVSTACSTARMDRHRHLRTPHVARRCRAGCATSATAATASPLEPGRCHDRSRTSKDVSRRSLSTSAATRSSRSTSSWAMVEPALVGARQQEQVLDEGLHPRAPRESAWSSRVRRSAARGGRRPPPSAEMIVVSGLRSSCDASPTNRCCAAWPASMRASISFMVSAKADISSRLLGHRHSLGQIRCADLGHPRPDVVDRSHGPTTPACRWPPPTPRRRSAPPAPARSTTVLTVEKIVLRCPPRPARCSGRRDRPPSGR